MNHGDRAPPFDDLWPVDSAHPPLKLPQTQTSAALVVLTGPLAFGYRSDAFMVGPWVFHRC
jgi:hypothetical protein